MGEGMTLEKLQVIIEAQTKPYRDEVEKLKRQTTSAASHVERQTAKMKKSFGGLGKVVASVLGVGAIVAFAKSCIDLGSDLAEVQNVVDVSFGKMSGAVDAFAKNAITQFGLSELTAKKYMGTYGAMAKAFGVTGEAGYQMSAAITGLTGDVASFYNLSTDEAYTKLKSIFTGETESLKDLGVVMTQTALDQYALNNGFGKTTAKMTEQEKVMLRYQFVMSSLADASGDFARTSTSWANQVRVLSLQFESLKATIGQGLINAFTPVIRVINTILAKLQTLAAYFKAFTVALFGDAGGSSDIADSMDSAAGSSGAVADNMNSAANAAKKMKEYTLGIDELNVLNPDEGSGGSGGGAGGGGSLDFGDMSGELFGEVTVNQEIEKAVERLRKAIDAIKALAKPTTDALKRLWNEGLSLLGKFTWTAIEDFWNYFLVPLGSWALGEGFPRFIDITNDFLKTINWDAINEALRNFWQALEPFAEKVGEGLLDFYEDLSDIGAAFINTVVPGGLNALADALNSIDDEQAKKIGYGLGVLATGLAGLKIAGIVAGGITALGNAIRAFPGVGIITGLFSGGGLLMGIQGLLQGLGGPGTASFDVIIFEYILKPLNEALDRLLPEWVTKFVGNVWAGLSLGFIAGSAVPGVGSVAGAIVGAIIGALNGIEIDGKSILKSIGDKIFNWDTMQALLKIAKDSFDKAFSGEGKWYEIGANIIKGIAAGISGAFAFLLEPIGDLLDWIVEGICNIFGIHSPAESMKPYGKYILEGIIEGFKATFGEWTDSMNEWFTQHISPWFTQQRWSELYETIKQELKTKWDSTVVEWVSGIKSWWNEHVSPWFTPEKWSQLYQNVKDKLKETWDNTVGEWKNGIENWWNQHVATWFTPEKWLGIYESIKSSLATTWSNTKDAWKKNLEDWWKEDVEPWFKLETWIEAMKGIPGAFKDAFNNAVRAAISILNDFIDKVNDMFSFDWDWTNPVTGTEYSGSVALFKIPHIPTFSTGGFPEDGLFMANHGELVGKFSNGRTAVANNEQIIDGIQRGVEYANLEQNALLREQNELLRALLEKNTVIQMDSREVGRTMDKSYQRRGYNFNPT